MGILKPGKPHRQPMWWLFKLTSVASTACWSSIFHLFVILFKIFSTVLSAPYFCWFKQVPSGALVIVFQYRQLIALFFLTAVVHVQLTITKIAWLWCYHKGCCQECHIHCDDYFKQYFLSSSVSLSSSSSSWSLSSLSHISLSSNENSVCCTLPFTCVVCAVGFWGDQP